MHETLTSRLIRRMAAAALLLAVSFLLPGGSRAAEPAAYKLGVGDKVRVTVYGEKDLSGDFDVNDQGEVTLPLIGAVRIAGRSVGDAENLITSAYGKNYLVNPHVNLQVMNYRPFFILGEVKNPGSYPYVNGMTVVNAIALAGGYTPRANTKGIEVKRGSNAGGGEAQVSEDAGVLPGDIIRVPERFF
jgi:protein involved in polysaccharide export with SLBB domain